MKWLFAALAFSCSSLAVVTTAYAQDVPANTAETRYTERQKDIWQWVLDNNPTLATSIRDRRGDGKLGDLSLETYDRQMSEIRKFGVRLEAIDAAASPAELRVDRDIQLTSLKDDVAGAAFDQLRYIIFTNRGGWFSGIASLPTSGICGTIRDIVPKRRRS